VEIPAGSDPSWLVLGQSLSDGWVAEVVGGGSLGTPTLIDGFANGWYLEASSDARVVEISWAPQRTVWLAIVTSGVWFLGLLVAALWFLIRPRRRPTDDDVAASAVLAPLRSGTPLPMMTALWTIGSMAVLGALLAGTGVAVTIAAITALAIWSRRHTLVTAAAMIVAISGIVVLYVGLQWHRHYPLGVEWPSGFWIAHQLGFVAILSMVAESVLRFVLRKRSNATTAANAASHNNDGSALTR
jgi:arabinofuranan 3-O-arabinosyltransferase